MNKLLLLSLFLIGSCCIAQLPRLSRYERRWAIFHPIAAIKIKKISGRCYTVLDRKQIILQLDSFENGGRADAFRHVFFMAAYCQKIKISKVRKLGKAHEKSNYRQFLKSKNEYGELPDSLSSVMDLTNNELGFQIGSANKSLSLPELETLVIKEIKLGKALVMKRNSRGDYLDCAGNIIDRKLFERKWNVPKCLVNSGSS